MSALARQLFFLALAASLSWWFLLRQAEPEGPRAEPTSTAPPLEVRTQLASVPAATSASRAPTPSPSPSPAADVAEPAPGPPPAERGDPEGEPDPEAPAERPLVSETELPQPARSESAPAREPAEARSPVGAATVEDLRRDPELLEEARRDFEGEVRRGFSTVLLAAPEDQVDLARTFGEELVLVPRAALDPEAERPAFFRLRTEGLPTVERVEARPPLESYRQYRDLFDYEYSRLPEPLRELRRSVLSRDEVYLFAALIPVSEWAVVIGRRREALDRLGRDVESVRRFVLRYVRSGTGEFDLRVEAIEYADGTRDLLTNPPTNRSEP